MQPPKYLTRFIGREEELAVIRRRLQGEHARLLSLTGPGGCGKTRLAAELVTTLEEAFEDGLRWVELVGVSQPDLVPQTVSSALQVTLAPGQSATEGLIAFLRNRDLLLVLDNCEHLVTACSQLVTVLLHNCPYLQVLVTSRETLHVDGENVWPVPPLSFPQNGDGAHTSDADLEALAAYPAVQLFVERARAASPDFSLSAHSAPAVRQICRTLEGMPLALELAAARVNLLGVDQIAQRLDPSLSLLSGGRRGGDARHEALRDTIEWSYTLLSEQERTVLQRAGIFSGGFTMEAAEVVCAAEAPRDLPVSFRLPTIPRQDIINLLGSLVNKSLMAVENQDPGRKRFRLLETIRHFALEKLQEAGEEPALRDLHLHYFLDFAEEAEPMLLEEEQLAWVARVSADYDNLQAALSWAIDKASDTQDATWAEVAWTLASRLFWYWNATDQFSEGRQWLEKTLAVGADPTRSRAGATALDRAGGMAWLQGDFETAEKQHRASLQLWETLDDDAGWAFYHNQVAHIDLYRGDAQQAIDRFQISARLVRKVEDSRVLGLVLAGWGAALALNGEHRAARQKTEEALAVFRSAGDTWGVSLALGDLGWAAFNEGNDAQAAIWLEEALQLRQELGAQWLTAQTSWHLGELYRAQGDFQRAEVRYEGCQAIAEEIQAAVWLRSARLGLGFLALAQDRQLSAARLFVNCLRLAVEQEEREGIIQALEGVTQLAARRAERETAVRLAGVCDAQWQVADLTPSRDATRRAELIAPWLQETRLQTGYEQGKGLSLDEAIALAEEIGEAWQHTGMDVQPARHEIRIVALGPGQVFQEGRELVAADWTFARPKELLFYLVAHPPQTKEQIGAIFWPDASPTQLRQSFRTTLYHLRQALGRREWVLFENGRYGFNRDLDYWYDVERFESLLQEAERLGESASGRAVRLLREATELYRGPFVADLAVDEWALLRRQELEHKYVRALLSLAQRLYSREEYVAAEQAYRRVVDHDALLESAHRGLMRCYAARGERALALRQYQTLVALLRDELGVAPSAESAALHARMSGSDEHSPN